MSSHRFLFYSPALDADAGTVALGGDEHHHLTRVLRAGPGDEVFVTNGRGLTAGCRVDALDASSATLAVTSTRLEENGPDVTLALGLIAKPRFAQALEQCVELGVTRVIPFVAAGSHLRRIGAGTVAHLRRVAVSAMKQSFRSWLTAVDEVTDFAALLDVVARADRVVFGDMDAPMRPCAAPEGSTLAVVGPEAGLSDAEVAALTAAGATAVRVSRHRLRSETAAVALVAALTQRD